MVRNEKSKWAGDCVDKSHLTSIFRRGLASGLLAFLLLCFRVANASVAPIVNALNDGGYLNEYLCPGGTGTVEDTIIDPSTSFYVGWWEVNVKSGSTVASWDLFLQIYITPDGSSEYLAHSYTDDSNRTPNVETTAIFDESDGDYDDTVFYFSPGNTYRLHMYHGGAGSCITSNKTLVRSAVGDNEPEVQDASEANDGITIYGYGEAYYSEWEDYTTSTDPYGYFEAYNSSTYGFTDQDFGWFGNAIVDVLKYLFVGPFESINGWIQLQLQNARYRAPGGYIVRIQEAWENSLTDAFESTSSTPIYATIALPGQATTTGAIFDSDWANARGFDINEWRIRSTYVIYFLLMLYYWNRARDFIDDLEI